MIRGMGFMSGKPKAKPIKSTLNQMNLAEILLSNSLVPAKPAAMGAVIALEKPAANRPMAKK